MSAERTAMTFAELLDQVLALLQRHGRVTYQAIQLQFQMMGSFLEDASVG
jgi:hypothetical protein